MTSVKRWHKIIIKWSACDPKCSQSLAYFTWSLAILRWDFCGVKSGFDLIISKNNNENFIISKNKNEKKSYHWECLDLKFQRISFHNLKSQMIRMISMNCLISQSQWIKNEVAYLKEKEKANLKSKWNPLLPTLFIKNWVLSIQVALCKIEIHIDVDIFI